MAFGTKRSRLERRERAPRPRLRRAAALVGTCAALLAAIFAAGTPGCWSPTAIELRLTATSAVCANGVETQIFVGDIAAPNAGADGPTATTSSCVPGEPRIGTLTIVPSGARDAQFRLEVVAGVGVSPDTCRADLSRCIVARRRGSFSAHDLRRLPVLLSDRCIGVRCGEDETCDLGLCVPAVRCGDTGCPREAVDAGTVVENEGGPPESDAAADAGADAGPPPCGPLAEVVVGDQNIVSQLALDGDDFLYAQGAMASSAVRRVRRSGGPAITERSAVGVTGNAPGIVSVVSGAGVFGFATVTGAGVMTLTRATAGSADTSTGATALGWASASIAMEGTRIVGLAAIDDETVPFGWPPPSAPNMGMPMTGVPSEIVTEGGHFFTVTDAAALHHFDAVALSAPIVTGSVVRPSIAPDLAVFGGEVYVTMNDGIHRIPRAMVTAGYNGQPLIPGVAARSLAADADGVFFLEGTQVWHADAGGTVRSLGPTDSTASRIAVDASCVYWVEGSQGARIMKRAKR